MLQRTPGAFVALLLKRSNLALDYFQKWEYN
jgi:hypothetical protein